MSNGIPLKLTLVGALLAAALIGRASDGFAFGFLVFGVLNVLVSPPGTRWVRAPAIAVSVAALAWPTDVRVALMLLAWLVWIPSFAVAWATARDAEAGAGADRPDDAAPGRRARVAMAAIIGAVALASVAYELVVARSLQQTAALFVGIPALLAIVVVLSVSPRTAIGVACKAVTIGLLISLIFLGEGILCIAMSAPLFYAVAVAIAAMVQRIRRPFQKPAHRVFSFVALLALVPMSMEGVSDVTSLNRDEWVSETRTLQLSALEVERAVFESPRFDRRLPLYLRAGFPRPVASRIERHSGQARWIVRFRGGEMRLDGIEPRAGDLILELAASGPGFVHWRAVADDSHMTHFLSWREARVHWEAVDAQTTRVTWTLRYRRGLDPAWYFGPLERYAATLAAGYLIETVATP